jgi:hypothetical protein
MYNETVNKLYKECQMFNDKCDINDIYDFIVNSVENGCEYVDFAEIVNYDKNDLSVTIKKDDKMYKITLNVVNQ